MSDERGNRPPDSVILAVLEDLGWPDDRGEMYLDEANIPAEAHWSDAASIAQIGYAAGVGHERRRIVLALRTWATTADQHLSTSSAGHLPGDGFREAADLFETGGAS